jgi:glycosyltransferase involved in cell wall biosynthesis
MAHRIVQIIPTLDRGGAEKQMTLLSVGLPRNDFEVHVCTLTRSGPWAESLRAAGVELHEIGKTWKLDPAAFWRLRRLLRNLQPEIVHTWIFAANCYGRQAAFAANVPHVVCGERCVDQWKVWHEFAIDRHLARKTDRVVTNSSGVVDFYAEHGIPREKFEVIPNGIESLEAVPTKSRSELLQELGLPNDAKLIGAIGRLWPQKRYRDLIWAAELLKVVRDDTHFLIIGDGPQLPQLRRCRENLRITDRVHFLGPRSDVPQILPHLDCFWLGSAYEGQSNALMEAMLAGRPVVVSDIPGNRDLVSHDDNGYLVPVGDRAGFARATLILLEDESVARRLGDAARQRMLSEFTIDRMVSRHASLYRRLLGDGQS